MLPLHQPPVYGGAPRNPTLYALYATVFKTVCQHWREHLNMVGAAEVESAISWPQTKRINLAFLHTVIWLRRQESNLRSVLNRPRTSYAPIIFYLLVMLLLHALPYDNKNIIMHTSRFQLKHDPKAYLSCQRLIENSLY